MPDSLEVTARHFLWDEPFQSSAKTFPPHRRFYRKQTRLLLPAVHALSRENGTAERPQALRCPKLKNHFSAEDAQSKAAGILNRLSPPLPRSGTSLHAASTFPVWKTAIFPAFSTRKNGSGPVLKTWDCSIPDWRKINRRSGTVCRMQRKSFDFLFYKRQNACIFIQNFPESGCLNYGAYRADPFLLLKTQWKKWKTSRKTRPFLHKSG